MKLFSLSILTLFFCSFGYRHKTNSVKINAALKAATVYRTGASLTHFATATLQSGDNELVIEGLSSYLDINSIQVNCPAAVTILGTEFSNNYLTPENISPAVQKLKDSMESVNMNSQRNNIRINTSNQLLEVLNTNRDVKGAQTGLSVAELTKLMNYYKVKSEEVQNDLLAYQQIKMKLDKQYSKLYQQIDEEQKRNTTSGGRLTLQLNVAVAGEQEFNITYNTQNASWTPYYDIRTDNIKSPLKFIYKAKIAQTTGIDWKKVQLSLSTSTPKQFGNAPLLKTWFLSYTDPVAMMNKDISRPVNVAQALSGKVSGLSINSESQMGYSRSGIQLRGLRSITDDNNAIYIVNGKQVSAAVFNQLNPNNVERVDVLKGGQASTLYGSDGVNGAIVVTLKSGLQDYVKVSDNELDVTYQIDLPYDVASTGKPQIATIKEATMPAGYKYYSVPKLDKEAYLIAEVANWQTLNLLPGEANIIFEGTYVGKSYIDPANTNDTLNITVGNDKRVVVNREKLKDYSSVKFIGTNRLQTVTYETTVRNNKKEPITITIKDQFPKSTDKDIEVKLLESSGASVNDESGVITWQMTLVLADSKKLRMTYSVKYSKEKTVTLN